MVLISGEQEKTVEAMAAATEIYVGALAIKKGSSERKIEKLHKYTKGQM